MVSSELTPLLLNHVLDWNLRYLNRAAGINQHNIEINTTNVTVYYGVNLNCFVFPALYIITEKSDSCTD